MGLTPKSLSSSFLTPKVCPCGPQQQHHLGARQKYGILPLSPAESQLHLTGSPHTHFVYAVKFAQPWHSLHSSEEDRSEQGRGRRVDLAEKSFLEVDLS